MDIPAASVHERDAMMLSGKFRLAVIGLVAGFVLCGGGEAVAASKKDKTSANTAAKAKTDARAKRNADKAKAKDKKERPAKGALSAEKELAVHLQAFSPAAMRRAIRDLATTYPMQYMRGMTYLKKLSAYEKQLPGALAGVAKGDAAAIKTGEEILAFQQEVLLANPLLKFGKILLIKRRGDVNKGLPANWQGNCALNRNGFDDEISILSPISPTGKLTTAYKPTNGSYVGEVDLHWDGKKMLFSQIGQKDRWQIHEANIDGSGVRQIVDKDLVEFDNYDAAYLPNEDILFTSSSVCHGVPCVSGKTAVVNLFRMSPDGSNARQLCFDQDHNWNPAVMNDGRVLYTRWEYTDSAHYFTRMLFRMNPDGTGQMEYYGSNSFWPNSMFYARPIPGHATKVAAIVSGHHGDRRVGELVIFDPARGRKEADGVVQRIPGYGQEVMPVIKDRLVSGVYPRFLHPYPLSENYFLVSAQLAASMPWGLYLVDVFDNLTPIKTMPGYCLLEPVPLRATPRPPVVADRVDLKRKDALVYLTDIYQGPGLKDVPRGTIKKLRVFEYHYAYNMMGGHHRIGVESGWDVKRIIGTVPVETDGSASFRVPANTPLAVQPLDENGQALQIMRSWFTAMPGEMLACVGCHEKQNDSSPNRPTVAARRKPSEITPWYGKVRGFSFRREVQPVLDKYCVGCHNGVKKDAPNFKMAGAVDAKDHRGRSLGGGFASSYLALHPYVRRPGPESDCYIFVPGEFAANTSELIQMLRKGHYGVKMDAEAWDRLTTWIDLNVPDHGTWKEQAGGKTAGDYAAKRLAIRNAYAGICDDPEAIPTAKKAPVTFISPQPQPKPSITMPRVAGWPLTAGAAAQKQAAAGGPTQRTVDLGGGVTMKLTLVPAGEFVMGDATGQRDELPLAKVSIDKAFWVGTLDVTNAQFGQFDPTHDSRYIDQQWKDHTTPGYPANRSGQPVIRISWKQATAFCEWLSEKTGEPFALPTEAQWEYAARAGTSTSMPWGDATSDFSAYANVADASIKLLAVSGVNPQPKANAPITMDFLPREAKFDDAQRIVCDTGTYKPNAWGLQDMHGNVAEWTRSLYRPYPYRDDERNDAAPDGERVVRGGSWRDRPHRCRSAFRLSYPQWQKVFNVGFRVVCPANGKIAAK